MLALVRHFLAFAALICGVPPLQAQTFPVKPVRIVVGYSPGGATDVTARLIAQELGRAWGQQVIVDNRPGASGTIGVELTVKAAADGHNLLISPQTSVVTAPLIFRKVNFDTLRDLAPAGVIGSTPLMLFVHPSLPPRNFKEFSAFVTANQAKLSYATGGIGSTPHLANELLNLSLGVKLVHVPYKGENPGVADVIGGQVPMMFANLPVVLPHVKAGKLRALAVTSPKRSPLAPEYPTIAESGLPGFDIATWMGLYAPAATPADLVDRLNRDLNKVMSPPEFRQRMLDQGLDPAGGTPEQHAAYLRSEFKTIGRIVKEAGIRAD
ncbi:MAG: Bug family tripartite tricarboxylate transporter substrate binding protein [Burkholderiales bacterium]